ncbi:MAG: antibiotic biosynthesis monooxygenase [Reyranella sp.]|uniref:putative quinol monooxygenase n=1 Tax=Reyranella sp. TaxID=1929291 RepID=UPI0025FA1B45|nr:putative quinol monooxygenase [Reyranella sp.]MBR2816524.1 antibiotic biosynthesis monooxygenase [Reyranella sp.]
MSHVTNIAFIRAKAGRSDALGQRLLALVEPSRREAGCINYDLHRSDTDPDLWCVYENWRSGDDLEAHFALPHMQAFVGDIPTLVDGDLDLRRFSMKSAPAPWRV